MRNLTQVYFYTLELVSSLAALLVAFGFIVSGANALTKSSVLTDIGLDAMYAIDASIAGTIRAFRYYAQHRPVERGSMA